MRQYRLGEIHWLTQTSLLASGIRMIRFVNNAPLCYTASYTCINAFQSKVNGMCAEKSEWLAQHGDCSEEEATQQTVEFHLRMQPYLDKLQPLTL